MYVVTSELMSQYTGWPVSSSIHVAFTITRLSLKVEAGIFDCYVKMDGARILNLQNNTAPSLISLKLNISTRALEMAITELTLGTHA